MGKHRIEVDHLGWFALPASHPLDGVAFEQLHACDDRPHLGIDSGTPKAIGQQRRDDRLTLDQRHRAARVASTKHHDQTGGGIEHAWPYALLDAHGLGDHLPAAAAELASMRSRTLEEIHTHRPGRLLTEQLQLQPVRSDLQGKLGVLLGRTAPEPLRPGGGLFTKRRRKRFDTDLRQCHDIAAWAGKPLIVPERSAAMR